MYEAAYAFALGGRRRFPEESTTSFPATAFKLVRFFQRTHDRLRRTVLDNSQCHHAIREQFKRPANATLGRWTAGCCDEPGFLLAIKESFARRQFSLLA